MDQVSALYRELDPLRPLGGDENELYVDWQRRLDPDGRDAKSRLVQTFRRNASPERPITRLLTGHRGCGKTTELNRVREKLASGSGGPRVFVSMLFADEWLDLEDVQPEDLVLQIVRQLVTDLNRVHVEFGVQKLRGFFGSLWDRVKNAELDTAEVGLDPLKFSFKLEHFPTARDEFRAALRGQLPTVFKLVNQELLPAAREQLRSKGFDDVLLIVDDLDRIPQKVLLDGGVTNHHNLFLDGSPALRAISCSLLLTVPIELAYSPAQARLRDVYGGAIETVPLLPIVDPSGDPIAAGQDALIEIIGRRARRAFDTPHVSAAACAAQIFAGDPLLRRAVQLSGGHLRGLLVIMTGLLDRIDALPVAAGTFDRYAKATALDFARALFPPDRVLLRQVAVDGESSEDPRFFELLRSMYLFAYRSEASDWYGLNPLLREITL